MERMVALMDKMYINYIKKKYPISPRYIKEVEDRIGKSLDKEIIGEDIYRSFSRNHIESNRGYGRGRGNFWRGNF